MAGERRVWWQVFLPASPVGVDQDLVAFQLVLAGKLASTDIAEVRPLAGVRLEVDGELRLAPELFAAEVAEQRAGWRWLGGPTHMHHLLVVLQVVGPHVGFWAEVAAVWLHARVDDLVRFEARATVEGFPADGTQPRLQGALLLQLDHAIRVEPVQVVLQVVAAVEAHLAQVAGEGLLPGVDEGVASQARLVLHHFTTHVAHRAVRLQLHRTQRCTLGVQVQLATTHSQGGLHAWGGQTMGCVKKELNTSV